MHHHHQHHHHHHHLLLPPPHPLIPRPTQPPTTPTPPTPSTPILATHTVGFGKIPNPIGVISQSHTPISQSQIPKPIPYPKSQIPSHIPKPIPYPIPHIENYKMKHSSLESSH